MQNPQNPNECLERAMFIASEGYSVAAYEMDFFDEDDETCVEEVVVVTLDEVPAAEEIIVAA